LPNAFVFLPGAVPATHPFQNACTVQSFCYSLPGPIKTVRPSTLSSATEAPKCATASARVFAAMGRGRSKGRSRVPRTETCPKHRAPVTAAVKSAAWPAGVQAASDPILRTNLDESSFSSASENEFSPDFTSAARIRDVSESTSIGRLDSSHCLATWRTAAPASRNLTARRRRSFRTTSGNQRESIVSMPS